MKKKSSRKIAITLICIIITVICIVSATVYYYANKHRLAQLQSEALDELDRNSGQYDERSIVLKSTSKARAEKLSKLFNAELRITKDGKYATLTLPESVTIRDIYAAEENLAYIEEMSVDYQVSLCDIEESAETNLRQPSRPKYYTTIYDKDYELQTYLDYLNMGDVWNKYTGRGITVAVIDSGIDTDHPEFAGHISEYSYNATEDKIVKDYTNSAGGYDWSLVEDEVGHGTAVTGVIASNIGAGNVVGVAPEVNIIVIKAEIGANGRFARTSDLIFGIYYAIERDVNVINMSFGAVLLDNPFEEATQLAYDSDIICVAAAGNEGTAALTYPAADPNVIGVGALDEGWTLASYSNYGENTDIVAPGTTHSASMGGGYQTVRGTSMACPIVSAAVALHLQSNKYVTFESVTEVLYASCYDIGQLGKDYVYGYGALDISAFILEERGTVTFDMLTDELDDEKAIFIRGHALQELPEPERLYAVFDGWYYDDTFTQKVEYYSDKFYNNITLYAKWVSEDDGVPFTYVILDDGTVEIRSYTGHRRYITVPEQIEGRIVSSIGDFAFAGQTRLREVELPSGLVRIGKYAFQNCSNLLHINIPANVRQIDNGAFVNNIRLSYVNFPDNSKLLVIGNRVFEFCSKIQSITLPASLTSVSALSFYGALELHTINVREGGAYYCSIDGVLFNSSGTTIIAYPAAHGTEYSLPVSTAKIADYAFSCAGIYNIDLNNIAYIGESAFELSSLRSVTIPDSVTFMGNAAFSQCSMLSELVLGNGLTIIPAEAFYGTALKELNIPAAVKKIDGNKYYEGAFASISSLEKLTFAEDSVLTSIGLNAFYGCSLKEITIPASVTKTDEYVFAYNPLISVIYEKGSKATYIQGNTFSHCLSLEHIVLPENLTYIGGEAFAYCRSLKAIDLPDSLQAIQSLAFENSGLTGITIPSKVIDLGAGAFAHCRELSNITVDESNIAYMDIDGILFSKDQTTLHTFPAGKQLNTYTLDSKVNEILSLTFSSAKINSITLSEGIVTIPGDAFSECQAQTITLPESLENIQSGGFSKCTKLRSLHIPDNVVQIGGGAFGNTPALSTITFNATSKLPRIGFGAFAGSGITSIIIPAEVSTIAQYAFSACSNLTTVIFAENSKIESLPAYVFSGCSSIKNLIFLPGSSLTSLQAHSLEGMNNITSIDFGNTKLANIDNFAFRFCDKLTEINLPETLTNIGRYAFYYCTSLNDLNVPASIEHIGSYAFLGTTELNLYFSAETLPAYLDENWDRGITGYYTGVVSLHETEDYKYAVLTSGNISIIEYLGNETEVDLNSLNFGAPITAIGGSAFEDCGITSVILPDTLTSIQAEAFMHNPLEKITIPASVTFIGREAFAHTDIATLNIPTNSSLKYIEQYAFEGTDNLKLAILPASLEKMGTGAFLKSGLEAVVFADGIKLAEIPQKAFAETKLIAVALPDSVTLVDHNAFNNVETLQSVSFGNNEGIRLMSNAFYHTGLTSLHIPENVTYIGEYCFVALKNLTEFTVDANNPNHAVIDGLLTTKSGRKLIAVPAGRTGTLNVPVSIEEIGFGAFEESSLSAINFDPNANILTFGYRAFFKANNITEMYVPASVVSIDYYAFAYCENLSTVTFIEGNQLKGVYEGAFMGCINLSNITLPDSIVEISDFAFYGCAKINKLPLGDSSKIKGIYSYAFAYTGLGGEFTIPETVYDIGEYAFLGTNLTKVTIPDANKKQLIIEIGVFEECNSIEEITLPFIGASYEDDKITWLSYIFGAGSYEASDVYVPESLKTVTLTEGITSIGTYGFANCTNLERINVPNSVSVLHDCAFANTTAEYRLTNTITTYSMTRIPGYHNSIQPYAYNTNFGTGITGELVLSDTVTQIGDWAFANCTKLTGITIPNSVTSIEYGAFSGCTGLTSIVIPNSVTSIEYGAFSGCTGLASIVIPNSVTTLGSSAFEKCSNLTSVTLPDSISSLTYGLFRDCTSLTDLVIPDSVTTIGGYVFYNCTNLESITIPENVSYIGDNTFYNCTSLKKVNITDIELWLTVGNQLYSSKYELYLDGELLTELVIPDSITEIDKYILGSNISIKHVVIGDHVTKINYSAFNGCSTLESVIIGDGVTTIGEGAFENCTSLTDLVLGDNVTTIERYAFYRCVNLSSITIPASLKSIGHMAFGGCENIDKIYISDLEAWCTLPADAGIITQNSTYDLYLNGEIVRELVIPGGIDSIGDYAFYNCTSLESVVIPEGVTSIGSAAFSGCTNLKSVTFSNSITSIDTQAFYGCTGLSSITIPKNTTNIGGNAFSGCTGLYTVYNNSSLPITIGNQDNGDVAYYANKLVDANGNITYSDDYANMIETPDGFIFELADGVYRLRLYVGDKDTVTLPADFNGNPYVLYRFDGAKNVIIPEGITSIGADGFRESNTLESVTLSSSVTEIKNYAFYRCQNLKSVTIPEGVTTIEYYAFYQCTALNSVVLPDSVTSLGVSAFNRCSALSEVVIGKGIKSIPGGAFEYCGLTSIVIPDTVTSIAYGAFGYCKSLTSVVLGDGLKSIKESVFQGCTALTSIDFGNGITSIGNAFSGCSALETLVIPDQITYLDYSAFRGCSGLKSITLGKNTSSIGTYAFSGCSSLESIIIPAKVKTIGYNTFEGCSNLKNVTILGNITSIGEYAFSGCGSLTSITLPDSVTSIGNYAFSECSSLANFTLPAGVVTLGQSVFSANTNVAVDSKNTAYKAIGGILYSYDLSKIIHVSNSIEENLIIPYGFTTIPNSLFIGNTTLKSIVIPDSVTSIGDSAFEGCTSLTSVVIPNSVTSIGNSAFKDCTALTGISLPSKLTSIGSAAFEGCTGITSIALPDSLTSLGGSAFEGCTALTSISIPDGVTAISANLFQDCTALTSVKLPKNTTSIGNSAFLNCTALTSIDIPYGVTSIGDSFNGCTALTAVTIPNSVVTIGGYAFYNCSSLLSIVIPDSVTSLGKSAFEHCKNLKSVVIGNGVTKIDTWTFGYCDKLTSVTIGSNVTSIEWYAFGGCTGLTSIYLTDLEAWCNITFGFQPLQYAKNLYLNGILLTDLIIPEGVTSISNTAFQDCTSLKSVTIHSGVTNIGASAFAGCTGVEKFIVSENNTAYCAVDGILYNKDRTEVLYIPKSYSGTVVLPWGITSIGDSAFAGYEGLTGIVIPDSVTSIGKDAFSGCINLKSIVIPDSVTSIGQYAFDGCINLKNAVIGDGVTTIGYLAFRNCYNLTNVSISASNANFASDVFYGCRRLFTIYNNSSLTLSCGNSNYGYIATYAWKIVDSNGNVTYRENSSTIIETSDGFLFDLVDGVYRLRAYLGDEDTVTLPKDINGNPYVLYCFTGPTNVIIPDGVTKIDDYAFQNSRTLKSITIPDSVTLIGTYAFYNSELTSIEIPDSIASIGNKAFGSCFDLTEVYITDIKSWCNITFVGNEANPLCHARYLYLNGTLVTNLIIPYGVTSISDYAFYWCQSLTSVVIPNSVTSIGNSAFMSCYALENIVFPNSITTIGYAAFSGCTSLTSVVVPDSVTTLVGNTFAGCVNLTTAKLGSGITKLGQIFYNCPSLTYLNIPDGVTSIGHTEFFGCKSLYNNPDYYKNGMLVIDGWLIDVDTDIEYLSNIKEIKGIATNAYEGCYKLKDAIWAGAAASLTNVETIYITKIYNGMPLLSNMLTLKNVVIMDSVRASDLMHCSNLFTLHKISGITIWVEANEEDLRWDDNFPKWHNGNTVVYGDDWVLTQFFDHNGTCVSSSPIKAVQIIRLPLSGIKSDEMYDYTVIGWDLDGDGEIDSVPATSVVNINAQAIVSASIRLYTVSFADSNGTVYYSLKLPYGASIALPSDPTKIGYTFEGWNGYSEDMTVSSDIVIYAEWEHIGDGHQYAEPVWVEATCTERGFYKYSCIICGEFYSSDYTPALGHSYSQTVVAPACTENGYILNYCNICSDSYILYVLSAKGHEWSEWIIVTEATCTQSGSSYRVCSVCGNSEEKVISVAPHQYSSVEIEKSTCTTNGKIKYSCQKCGKTVIESTNLTAHNYVKHNVPKAWVDRLTEQKLDLFYDFDGISYYCYECTDCGHIMINSERGSAGLVSVQFICVHNPGNWTTICAPTCDEMGVEGRYCTLCNNLTIARTGETSLGHILTQYPAKPATCSEIGWNSYEKCSRCSYTTYAEIPATGLHTHSYFEYDKNVHWSICSVCKNAFAHSSHKFTDNNCFCGLANVALDLVVAKDVEVSVYKQTVTVKSVQACIVAYLNSDGSYSVIRAAMNPDGDGHSFIVPDGVSEVFVSIKGDYNADGKLTADDASSLKNAILGKANGCDTETYIYDIDSDGNITALDIALIDMAAQSIISLW